MKQFTLVLMIICLLADSGFTQNEVNPFGKSPIDKSVSTLKNLTSTITTPSSVYIAGTAIDLTVVYNHETIDGEYVDGISLTFPAGVTVNSATDAGYAVWNLETGDGVETTWGDMAGNSGSGSISVSVQWIVNITIDSGFTNDLTVNYLVVGEGYGTDPHSVSGNFVLSEASPIDLSVTGVTPNYIDNGNSVNPVVTVMNNGLVTQDTFDVQVVVNDGTSDVYSATKNLTAAGLDILTSVDFAMDDEWTPIDGDYTITATVIITGDADNTNDTISIDCFVGSFFEAQAGNSYDFNYGSITLSDGTYTVKGALSTDPFPMAEEFDGTNIYRVYIDSTYGTVDLFGIYTEIGTFSGVAGTPSALAYDHVNGIMYVCMLDGNFSQLCTLDVLTGVLTLVGTAAEGRIIGMDFANDGMIYGPELDGDNLFKIDPSTGEVTVVGPLGINITSGQDVSYDFETNRLYTIITGFVFFQFGYYNISTGAFNFIAEMGGDRYCTFVITKTPVGPLPITFLPEDLATDVAIDATVSATFNGNISATDLTGIIITPDPGNVSASIVDNILTIAHDDFAYTTEYTVTVPMASINDGSDDLAFDLEWSFTTALDPTICNDPSDVVFSDITANTVTVEWTENGPAIEWKLVYGVQNFDPLTEGTTIIAITDQTIEFTGLTAITNYDVYIQSICSNGDESVLVGPFQFVTECDIVTDLDEGFETSVPPICWKTYQAGLGTKVWWQSNENPNGGTYSASAYYQLSTGENQQWLVTRGIEVPLNHKLTFYATDKYSADYASTLNVKVSTDNGATYTDLLTIAETDVTAGTYSYFWTNVAAYGGQDVKFAFVMIDDDGDTWCLDDVKLEALNDVEISSSNSISIYPNPSTGLVNITSIENSEVTIIDITGRIIEAFTLNAFETVNFVQPAGMYVVQVESNGEISTHKLLIK